ncbi:bacteriocin-associated integral membrane family protein [Streptococcus pneumoniae]|uniref:bacteriocin-associated integral membrane family protein n=1 Tax=Streptococcus pneumoniae TaxID=1313 RepID=UPI0023607060|nr:bacteriocin-associated integral membrane family protein [Streptococcus pneumoniae]MDD0786314.1 bacteriocin-associated integral membrane family protein [Streptococcus pneumoniae]MDS4649493.1 bacteriocin-associated integral membrane family protein [Streptococcus pneumoniae]
MKKLFILLSTFFLSFFLAWIIVLRAPQYLYASYDSVSLLRVKKDTQEPTREVFEQELENFANSEQSLIARRIVEPSKDGTTHFTYATYGQGTLPKEFQEASQESRERSDPLNSYLLLSGSLTKEKLADKLGDLGYKAIADRKTPPYSLAFRMLLNPLILISLAIFGLSFFALVIITRIKEMRAAGIKLFSGQTLLSIMGHSLSTDIKWLLLSALLSFLGGGVVLFSQGLFYPILLATYGFGISFYLLFLLAISILLMLLYLMSLSYKALVPVIKGRLPLKRLMILTLLCQLVAVFTVGYAVKTGLTSYQRLKELEISKQAWHDRVDYYQISFGLGDRVNDTENQNKWYEFSKEAVEKEQALFVKENLIHFANPQGKNENGETLDTYSPDANVLYVSPSYLDKENVAVNDETRQKLAHLQKGEFGLLLPESLRSQEAELKKVFEERLNYYGKSSEDKDAPLEYEMRAIVSYLPTGQKRFVYNNGESPVSIQYLTDPILVVFTPTSTGDSFISKYVWSINAGKQLFIKGYESGLELLKKAGIYEQVSYLKEGRSVYLTRYNEVQTETATLILGAIVGIASSLLLFYSVNLLYFEQFRRDILIKRISGLRFFETHAQYMVSQFASFVFGASLFILSSRDLVIGLLTLLVFLASAVLTLYRQAQKESRVSMTIMKGK